MVEHCSTIFIVQSKNHPKQKTEHPIGVVFLSRRVQWLLLSTINYTATPKKSHMRKRKRNPATIPSTPELETRGVPYIYIYTYIPLVIMYVRLLPFFQYYVLFSLFLIKYLYIIDAFLIYYILF